jgi:Carboxypeptidase regulatory-like domain
MVAIVLTLLFTPFAQASRLQQTSQPSIEGVVRRADTGEPINGAQVTLGRVDPGLDSILGQIMNPPGVQPVTTDSEGKFAFRNLNPGSYRILASANGYASRSYGQQNPNGPATPVSVTADQPLRDAAIQLLPVGTISGEVLDEHGSPATGAPVQVLRVVAGTSPPRYQPVGSGIVDDRGIYRVYSIMPGRYYLSVGSEVAPPPRPSGGPSSSASARNYAFQFFPGVTSVDQAVPVDLQPGTDLSIDMKTRLQQTYRVRGTVTDLTGRPPARSDMKLSYKSLLGGDVTLNLARNYDLATGRFEVEGIPPGSFILQAQTQVMDDASRAAGEAAWSMFPTARIPIEVKDEDLDGVVMIQTRPAAVSGQVRFESAATVPLSSATLRLTPLGTEWLPPTAFVAQDGAFRVDGILEGKYSVQFGGFPHGFYVRSITYAGADILNQPWQFSGSASGTIGVVLSRGAAQLSGIVRDAQSAPVGGGQVVLVPEQRSRRDLYRLAGADQNGRYTFSDVVPGTYKLFSWETMEYGAYLDPKFVEPFEQQGRAIRLPESSTAVVDVRVIPNGNR